MTEIETHPFFDKGTSNIKNIRGGFFPEGMKVLIVGTFPPKINYFGKEESYFFYPNAKNQFWYIIDSILKDTIGYQSLKKTKTQNKNENEKENCQRKKEFSTIKHLGFIDVFTKIKRSKENDADDSGIIPIEDIFEIGLFDKIIQNSGELKRICCLYSLAFEKTYNYIKCKNPQSRNFEIKVGEFGSKLFEYKGIEIIKLSSPRFDYQPTKPKIDQYKFYLFDKVEDQKSSKI
jgi:hypothetical protein